MPSRYPKIRPTPCCGVPANVYAVCQPLIDHVRIATVTMTTVQRGAPPVEFLALSITGRCQLTCSHCFASSGPDGTHGAMTTDDWERLVYEAAVMGVRRVQFIGGEQSISAAWMSAGSVREQSLPDILASDRMRALMALIPTRRRATVGRRDKSHDECNPDSDGGDCAPAEQDACGPDYCNPE